MSRALVDLKAFSTRLVTLSRTTMKSTLKEAWQEDRGFSDPPPR